MSSGGFFTGKLSSYYNTPDYYNYYNIFILFLQCSEAKLYNSTPPPPPTPSPHVHTQHTATGGGYAVTPGYQAVNTKGFDSPPAYAPNPSAPSPNGQPAPQYPGNQVPPYYYPQAPRGPPQQVNDCYI